MNKLETDSLRTKIHYYCNIIQGSSYFEVNGNSFEEKLLDILAYPSFFPLQEVLFDLLYKFVLLPDYKNQNQFNEQMKDIINRLDNFVYKFSDYLTFIVKPLDNSLIVDYFLNGDFDDLYVKWKFKSHTRLTHQIETKPSLRIISRKELTKSTLIESMSLDIYMPSLDEDMEDLKWKDYVGFEVDFTYDIEDFNVKAVLESILASNYSWVWENLYLIWKYPELNLYLTITKNSIARDDKIRFKVKFYTEPNSELDDDWAIDYLSNSLIYLEDFATKFAKYADLNYMKKWLLNVLSAYKTLIKDKPVSEDMLKWLKSILQISTNEKIYEGIKNLINEWDFENAIDKAIDYITKLKYPKSVEIVDFNEKIEELKEKEDNNRDFDVKASDNYYSSSKFEIITEVSPTDVADKLFLPETTQAKLNMLLGYLKNREEFLNTLFKAPRWAIFYWPPGTWKTETVKFIAKDTGFPVYTVDVSSILDMYVWESERKIKQMFEEYYKVLKDRPAILFIDEADGFFWKRDGTNNDLMDGVRSIALQELEWFSNNENLKNWFIILWTNFLNYIDKALKERFSFFLKYELPKSNERKDYIDYMINRIKEKNMLVNIDVKNLVSQTEGFSYRALFNLFNNALMYVLSKDVKKLTDNEISIALEITQEEKEDVTKVWFRL